MTSLELNAPSIATPARPQGTRCEFEAVYETHYAGVASLIFARTGRRDVTLDLTSEVFLSAWRHWANFSRRGVPVEFWLLRIAGNRVRSWARAERRRLARERRRAIDPGASAEAPSREQVARDAFLTLGVREQEILSLHYFRGLGVRHIAEALGIAEGTVKSRLSRARESLARALARHDGTEHGDEP